MYYIDADLKSCGRCPIPCYNCILSVTREHLCTSCIENMILIGDECTCDYGYKWDDISNRCVLLECKASISLAHSFSSVSVLEYSEECYIFGMNICDSTTEYSYRYITSYSNLLPILDLPYIPNYHLNILILNQGGLLYRDSVSNIYINSMSNLLLLTFSETVPLSGYISHSSSGLHTVTISYFS